MSQRLHQQFKLMCYGLGDILPATSFLDTAEMLHYGSPGRIDCGSVAGKYVRIILPSRTKSARAFASSIIGRIVLIVHSTRLRHFTRSVPLIVFRKSQLGYVHVERKGSWVSRCRNAWGLVIMGNGVGTLDLEVFHWLTEPASPGPCQEKNLSQHFHSAQPHPGKMFESQLIQEPTQPPDA
jgi:hypothetical protein